MSSSPTPRDAVVQAYLGYLRVSEDAAKLPEDQARVLLAPYMTPDGMAQELAGAAEWRAKHFEPWGRVVGHVTDVQIKQRTATVTDCQDGSAAGIADTRTHRLIPRTVGGPHIHVRADMSLGDDGRWRVKLNHFLGTSCTPPTP